jgi:hypothetical protein
MRLPIPTTVATIAVLALTVAAPARAHAQQALQLNQIMQGSAGDDAPAVFTFNAETAGVLTVVVRGDGDVDLQLAVADAVGQTLPDGEVDQDLGGDGGAEQAAVVIRAAGDYQVRVSTWFGGGTFDIIAGWISYPTLGGPADPDGMPTAAATLAPGTPIDDSIDPSAGDAWDWFKVTADSAGVITVVTEAPEGDLALEVFGEGSFAEAINRSDQDMQGVAGNESLTIQTAAGQTYYFKVSPVFSSGDAIAYRIRVGIM